MTQKTTEKRRTLHPWIRIGFVVWAVFAMSWLVNSVRTQGVDENMLRSSQEVSVLNNATRLEFLPISVSESTGLVFICGSGIAAEAYAPLLRPLAEKGFPIFIVKLPYRFAPLDSHKRLAMDRVHQILSGHPEVKHWVLGGHSLGGALAARMARSEDQSLSALLLVATTHPKNDDLAFLNMPVTKIFASNDGIATRDKILANRGLLPPETKWVEISGGNHSQFGRYGRQLLDGTAAISREKQEALTRSAILHMLIEINESN